MAAADGTLLTMTSPLADGVLQPVALHAQESISAPFLFVVRMVSTNATIQPSDVLYQPMCVTINAQDTPVRSFHGIVRSFHIADKQGDTNTYIAELVPQLWFADQTMDCRVFHAVSSADIITTILNENGISSPKVSITGNKEAYDFTVQYNETDLTFITRLMEQEGYFYYFEHTDSAHTLVISDGNTVFQPVGNNAVSLVDTGGGLDGITDWRRAAGTAIGKVTLTDYDYANPATPVTNSQTTVLTTPGGSSRDIFIWPALTAVADTATARATVRQQAAEAFAMLVEGNSANASFVAGGKFTLGEGAFLPAGSPELGDYVIRSVVHDAVDEVHGAGGSGGSYSNSFSAFPAATKWRQPLVVPRPVMAGIHTAIVLGDSGEEIHTDDQYRIKVQFFWDHVPTATADNTLFVRVMQPWSGNAWGWQHIPRVGTEVAVAFVNGDPDHPLVIGCLYNGTQAAPFPLTSKQTVSGIKTRSTPNGGTADYNEFSFDDAAGSEIVLLHAQKDHTVEVENDQTITVMHDQKLEVDNDQTTLIKHDQTFEVDNDQTILIKHDRKLTVTNDRTTEISTGNDKLTIDKGNLTIEVTAGDMSTTVDKGAIATKATLGDITIEATAGNVTITALKGLTLKCGPTSQIAMTPQGIEIKGMTFTAGGTLNTEIKGLMTKVGGDAMLMVKGAITMIG